MKRIRRIFKFRTNGDLQCPIRPAICSKSCNKKRFKLALKSTAIYMHAGWKRTQNIGWMTLFWF